jgi:hypothetical protein
MAVVESRDDGVPAGVDDDGVRRQRMSRHHLRRADGNDDAVVEEDRTRIDDHAVSRHGKDDAVADESGNHPRKLPLRHGGGLSPIVPSR